MRADTNRCRWIRIRRAGALWLGLAVGTASVASQAAAQARMDYVRRGKLPPMITTRGALEQLTRDLFAVAQQLAPGDSIVRGAMSLSLRAQDTRGRAVNVDGKDLSEIDSLAINLDRRAELTQFSIGIHDLRSYAAPVGPVVSPHMSGAEIGLYAESYRMRATMEYTVFGAEKARVDSIANRLDAFGRRWMTTRTPEAGERIRMALKALAVILIALALGLRDRRHTWVFYPVAALLVGGAYLVPFEQMFTACRILGGS
jgi:hypothetical protein